MLRGLLIAAAMLLAAACASDEERAAADAARRACENQYPNNPSQIDACVAQMEASIRDARVRQTHPPPAAKGAKR